MTTAVTISGRVAELHATMAAQPPNEVMGAFRREQAGLAAAGLPDGIAPAGTVIADADLLDAHGASTSLYAATGDAVSVAVFYRGGMVPVLQHRPRHPPGPAAAAADLTAVNADATITLPMPATVILDARHVLRWIDVHPDYSTRSEPQQILDALERATPTQR